MKALQIRRSVAKFGMARIASAVAPAAAARIGPLELRSTDDPPHPGAGWRRVHTRLAGICGSDLSLVEGHASTYFDDFVSFPFVPGHEVVGELDDGTRVVIEPVLGHAARGHALPFEGAAPGDGDDYAHLATPSRNGLVEPGIQTGFCCSTGGGWSPNTDALLRDYAQTSGLLLIAATDRNRQGETYAERLRLIAQLAGCLFSRLLPQSEDWNEDLKALSHAAGKTKNRGGEIEGMKPGCRMPEGAHQG